MGDRGSIGFRTGPTQCIWLYTHWRGGDLLDLAHRAVRAAQPRWDDPPYATRMALTALISGIEGETGWGVDTDPQGDLEHDALVIDWENGRIVLLEQPVIDDWYRLDRRQREDALDLSIASSLSDFLTDSDDAVTAAWDRHDDYRIPQ